MTEQRDERAAGSDLQAHTIEVDRFEQWRATVCGSLLRFEVDCSRPEGFRGAVTRRNLAGIGVVGMASGPHAAFRGANDIVAGETAEYIVSLQLTGRAEIAQDGRTAQLGPGELAFYDSSRPVSVLSGAGYRSVCLQFPRSLTRARPEAMAALTATTLGERDGLAPVVSGALDGLHRSLDRHRGGPAALQAARQTVGLFTSMVVGQLDARRLAPPDPRRELRERVDRYIDRHLPDPDLSPGRIAAAHHVSTRHVHAVFAADDETVAATVRARRLERALADLADPWQADVPVAAIALRWGFRTPSRFGQVCKGATGLSPARYRVRYGTGPRD